MKRVTLSRIVLNEKTPEQTICLREVGGRGRIVPIVVGIFEANAIQMGLYNIPIERPMTHDLVFAMLDSLKCSLLRVDIVKLEKGTFYAELVLETPTGVVRVDCRPSDAISLSTRREVPIYMSPEVFASAAVKDPAQDADNET